MEKQENHLFPVFLKLSGKKVLVVGGGDVALEKINTLVRNTPGVQIYAVAPEFRHEIIALRAHANLHLFYEKFNHRHLAGMDLVITATGKREVAEEVKQLAGAQRIWVNTADVPDLCDFYLGSVVQKGALKMAISTNGKSPTLARRLREVLEDSIPDETAESIEQLHELRKFLKGDFRQRVEELNKATQVLVRRKNRNTWSRSVFRWLRFS